MLSTKARAVLPQFRDRKLPPFASSLALNSGLDRLIVKFVGVVPEIVELLEIVDQRPDVLVAPLQRASRTTGERFEWITSSPAGIASVSDPYRLPVAVSSHRMRPFAIGVL